MSKKKKIELKEGEILGPSYVKKDDKEIKELALALYRGEIFTSMQIPENQSDLLQNIFMPLIFMDIIHLKQLEIDKITHMYSSMKDAGQMSINGFPIFFSMAFLNQEDTVRLIKKYEEIKKVMEEI